MSRNTSTIVLSGDHLTTARRAVMSEIAGMLTEFANPAIETAWITYLNDDARLQRRLGGWPFADRAESEPLECFDVDHLVRLARSEEDTADHHADRLYGQDLRELLAELGATGDEVSP